MQSLSHSNGSAASTTEFLKKVRKIEIRTKSLSHQIFAGEYHSAFKGRGMTFSEVREYQWGDDVRSMDWNVTARLRQPYVKVFEEERELTMVLMIDVSRSGLFGSVEATRRERIAEVAAVLSFSAILNNDKVGALFFSDKVEKFIPPKKGRSHLLHIIREMLELEPTSDGTDISAAMRFLTGAIKKKCNAFLLSDLMDVDSAANPLYEEALKVLSGRHDLSVIRVSDPLDRDLPAVGLIHIKDSETGRASWVNTDSARVRQAYRRWHEDFERNSTALFNRFKVKAIEVSTEGDYVKSLMGLFR